MDPISTHESISGDKPSYRVYATMGAIIGWASLLLQFYLIITFRIASIPETILRFFTFFTILSNILVAVCYTFALRKPREMNFFMRVTTVTAATVYITIVGLVYNIILRPLWDPKGLQKLADESLHSVVPILFLFFWIIYIPKKNLQWSNILPWLIFPLVYIIIIVIRGEFTGYYPYPFVNVATIGYQQLLINSFIFLFIFMGFSALFVALGRWSGKRKP